MRLFHGSSIVVSEPRIGFSRSNLDFGRGFYATSIRTQAERWAKRKAFLDNSSTAIVSEFELGDLTLFENAGIQRAPDAGTGSIPSATAGVAALNTRATISS